MKRKKLTAMLLGAGMVLSLLAGCQNTGDKTGGHSAASSASSSTAGTDSSSAASGSTGDSSSAASGSTGDSSSASSASTAEIGNVVASSVAIVEILDAMNVPMVGVPTSSYALPESVADAARIGNPMSPDMEVVASLEPDYIISVNSLEADLGEQFKALGAETYYADLSSYEALKTTITDLGSVFGTEDKAGSILSELEEKEKAVKEKITGKEAPSVLIVFGAGNSFMAASEETYVGDLVRMVGGENVVVDAPSSFSPIDMEYLAAKNPDCILLMAHANPEESLKALKQEFETNEAWQNFDAVKDEKVYALETGYFGMSANLAAGEALEKLVDLLYQES